MTLPPLVEPGPELTAEQVRRYARHLIVPDVGVPGQRRLANARVLCVGAGGLGSATLMYLAAAGVGTLGIVDFDTVDESNLQRQIIHGQSDLGRLKVDSAADTIAEINPFVRVIAHREALTRDNVLEIFEGYDLVVDGADNFATRYLVNDAAVRLGKPYVWGSIFRFDGQASVFWSQHGPCYRCLYPEPPPPGLVPSCAEGGVLGVLCASIGSIQATEAVKLIVGFGTSLLGSLMVYDATEMTYRKIKVRKDPDCPLCGTNPTITDFVDYPELCGGVPAMSADGAGHAGAGLVGQTGAGQSGAGETAAAAGSGAAADRGEISALELRDWIAEDRPMYLVDVREPVEYEIVRIPGSVLVPKGRIVDGDATATLPRDRQIVLYCKSGFRSAAALAAVRAAGHADAVHLAGGIDAWITTVDPTLPRY